MTDDFESWHLPHMHNMPNDANLIQSEGFGVVRDGLGEMACTAGNHPEPESITWRASIKTRPGLLARLWRWLMRPICNL